MQVARLAVIAVIGSLITSIAGEAQHVYPASGQDQATQAKDETECSAWATRQTGFAPGQLSATVGAQTGAAVDTSAVISGLGATPGGGATRAGAVHGSAGQLTAASQLVSLASQAKPQAQASGQADFDTARAVCLNGRGYSVQ
jgi:hypothetical protein